MMPNNANTPISASDTPLLRAAPKPKHQTSTDHVRSPPVKLLASPHPMSLFPNAAMMAMMMRTPTMGHLQPPQAQSHLHSPHFHPYGGGSSRSTTGHAHPRSPAHSSGEPRRRNNYLTENGPYFTPTQQAVNAWSRDKSRAIKFQVGGKINRGFFMADGDWTCYRRNYFQISTSFNTMAALPDNTDQVVSEFDTNHEPVMIELPNGLGERQVEQFKINIQCRLAGGDKLIGLVQHTSKRDKGPQLSPKPLPIRAGGHLMPMHHQQHQQQLHHLAMSPRAMAKNSVVTFERVQFKAATANNGKRKANQQHFVIEVMLYATVRMQPGAEPQLVQVATCQSAPLIVRGRSPSHYQDSPSVLAAAAAANAGMMVPTHSMPGTSTMMYHPSPDAQGTPSLLNAAVAAEMAAMMLPPSFLQNMSPNAATQALFGASPRPMTASASPMQQLSVGSTSSLGASDASPHQYEPSPLNIGGHHQQAVATFQLPDSMSPAFKHDSLSLDPAALQRGAAMPMPHEIGIFGFE